MPRKPGYHLASRDVVSSNHMVVAAGYHLSSIWRDSHGGNHGYFTLGVILHRARIAKFNDSRGQKGRRLAGRQLGSCR